MGRPKKKVKSDDLVLRYRKAVNSFKFPENGKVMFLTNLGVNHRSLNAAMQNRRIPAVSLLIRMEPIVGKDLTVEAVFYRLKRRLDENRDDEYTASIEYLKKNAPEEYRAWRKGERAKIFLRVLEVGDSLATTGSGSVFEYWLDGKKICTGTIKEIASKTGYSESYVATWRFKGKNNEIKQDRRLIPVEV